MKPPTWHCAVYFSLPDGLDVKNTKLGHTKMMAAYAPGGTMGMFTPAAFATQVSIIPVDPHRAADSTLSNESQTVCATMSFSSDIPFFEHREAAGHLAEPRAFTIDGPSAQESEAVPASIWLFGAGLAGLGGLARKRRVETMARIGG